MEEEKRPKPTPEEYRRFRELEAEMEPGEWNDEWVELYDARDWTPEVIKEGEKLGLTTALGEMILPPEFEELALVENAIVDKGARIVAKQNGRWGVVNADGNGTWMVEPEYDYIGYPNDITNVKVGEKWGVLNITTGEYIIPPECDRVFENNGFMFLNGIGSYSVNGKTGIITEDGDFTEALFDAVDPAPVGWVKVMFEGSWGFIDENDRFTENLEDAAYSFD